MSDIDVTASMADRGRDLRIQGQIIPPPGTTVGDVLTATATGSSWQTGGGGGTFDRGVYDSSPATVCPSGVTTPLAWAFDYGDPVLDLTTPSQPLVVTAGIYAVSAWAKPGADYVTEDVLVSLNLGIDVNNDWGYVALKSWAPAGGERVPLFLALTYYCRAGSVIDVELTQTSGADMSWTLNASVQLVRS